MHTHEWLLWVAIGLDFAIIVVYATYGAVIARTTAKINHVRRRSVEQALHAARNAPGKWPAYWQAVKREMEGKR